MMSSQCSDEDDSRDSKFSKEKSDEDNDYQCGDCPTVPTHETQNIHEMGEALEIAENRCNTLKQQLDHMRCLYREKSTLESEQTSNNNTGRQLVRQNSECIKTDNTGAAVLTINNILNGITNSINRLSELHSFVENDCDVKEKKHTRERLRPHTQNSIQDQPIRKSRTQISNERKKDQRKRFRRRNTNEQSLLYSKTKPKVVPASIQPHETASLIKQKKGLKKPIKPLKRINVKKLGGSSNHLVEIYHNNAVDYVDSEEILTSGKFETRNKPKDKLKMKKLSIMGNTFKTPGVYKVATNKQEPRSLSPIQEQETAISTYNQFNEDCMGFRSYENPTISSKMKQVPRGFRNFTTKTIPFCAAKSTTPSHNIGINIQQVMSILKGKQNARGISPTLAHNIALAADRLNRQSYSGMIQTLGNQICINGAYIPCPMQNNYNYQQLQDMAQQISDEPVDYDNAIDQHKQHERLEEISWSIDPNQQNSCTCASSKGVSFNQIIDKYQSTPKDCNSNYSQAILRKSFNKYKHIRSVYSQFNDKSHNRTKKDSLGELSIEQNVSAENLSVSGKEKILKGVLINLHQEFVSLSDKYDELSKIIKDEKGTADDMEKLESLEKKLNEKEIEIQMVMSLYHEVTNLKRQVQVLTEKAHMSSAMLEHQKQQFFNYNPTGQQYGTPVAYQPQIYNFPRSRKSSSNAAMHLTKLLKQIQAYQEVYKNGS